MICTFPTCDREQTRDNWMGQPVCDLHERVGVARSGVPSRRHEDDGGES